MARNPYFVGLDVGSSVIRVVAAEQNETSSFAIVGIGEAQADGVRKGAVVNPDMTAKSIQRAFYDMRKNFNVQVDHAYVSLGEPRLATYVAKGAVSVSRADGEVTREDISRVLEASESALPRLGNREIVHTFPLFYSVDRDTGIREPLGLNGMKLEVEALFVAAFTGHLKNLIRAVEQAGISLDDVPIAAPYAAAQQALTKKQREVGCLLLDIGSQTSTLAVFEEGLLVSLEVIPYGSGHVTFDIGLGFEIDLQYAERVKRNLSSFLEQGKKEIRLSDFPKNFEETFSQRKLRDIVSARLGDIFELVQKHLKRIDRAELLPGGVVLVGGGARMYEIQNMARENLHLPIETAISLAGVGGEKELVSGPEWATALGLARYAAEQHEPQGRFSEVFSSPLSRRLAKIFRAFIP